MTLSTLPELLIPLNGWKSITPNLHVLENADAVYFGLQTNFSMRARADNFQPEDLTKLMKLIHEKGKKGYLTTNIVIYNEELVELYQTLELAKSAGVDAVICHDIATIMIAKELQIPFHISTQANISNTISAKFYQEIGAERLILARELSLEDISRIIQDIAIPIETFIHGAMCSAVSGRCYLSSELMGFNSEFSANRGKCVQPCRRYYHFLGEEQEEIKFDRFSGMFFNAKDLCMIEYLPQLIAAGIKSLKIEGRMRDPLYISEVASCYREALISIEAGNFTQEKASGWKKRLGKVFNRGFHTGYYFQKPQFDDIQRQTRGNVSKWHKIQIGKVLNYYSKANAVEIELYSGKLTVGDEVIFENKADLFHRQTIKSIQFDGTPISATGIADKDHHLILGLEVDAKIPKNALVYLYADKNEKIDK